MDLHLRVELDGDEPVVVKAGRGPAAAARLRRERRRLLAMRAAFGLSWLDLTPYSADPIGDLEAGRLDPLVAALYAEAGLRPPAHEPGAAAL